MVKTFSTHKIMLGQVEPKCVLLLKVSFVMPKGEADEGRQLPSVTEEATFNRFMLSYCILCENLFVLWLCETNNPLTHLLTARSNNTGKNHNGENV